MTASPGIGVDVVDLRNPRTRGRHHDPRFLERVFDESEQDAIRSAEDPDGELWLRWAAKEAAFKAIGIDRHPAAPPVFDHSAFVVTRADAGVEVHWEDQRLGVELRIDPRGRWCGASAATRSDEAVSWRVADVEDTAVRLGIHSDDALRERLGQSELAAARGFAHGLVRLAARTEVARRLDVAPGRLEIVSASGSPGRVPPLVHLDGEFTDRARVSLSHDGPRIAWGTWVAQ